MTMQLCFVLKHVKSNYDNYLKMLSNKIEESDLPKGDFLQSSLILQQPLPLPPLVEIHEETNVHLCPHCGDSFQKSSSLTQHIFRIHEKKKTSEVQEKVKLPRPMKQCPICKGELISKGQFFENWNNSFYKGHFSSEDGSSPNITEQKTHLKL